MGNAARRRRHDQKMRMKRAAKAAKRTAYAALRGTSRKAKKLRGRSRTSAGGKHLHRIENCGNIGCKRCFPQFSLEALGLRRRVNEQAA